MNHQIINIRAGQEKITAEVFKANIVYSVISVAI